MKILQINNCHFRRGGADSVYLNTIWLLKQNGNEVIEFSQFSQSNDPSIYTNDFIEEFNVLGYPMMGKIKNAFRHLYSNEAAKKLAKLLEKTKPDIAHIHLYKGVLTAAILPILKRLKVPIVITLHDYSLLCPRNILFDGDNKICEKCINASTFNVILKRCNRKNLFYSTINFLEYNLNNNFYKPEHYFSKIISVSKFNFQKHALRSNLKPILTHLYNFFPNILNTIPDNTKGQYFLYFGRLTSEKGLNTLFDTVKYLPKSIKIKVAGTGVLMEELENKIKAENISNIEMLGFKSGDELVSLIIKSSFVIVPSEWYENNPMTIVEGYSYGKPVIASRIGGIPELILEGETGYTFEMANTPDLVKVIIKADNLSNEAYAAMSANARNFALENFADARHYQNLMGIYKDTILNYPK